MKTRLLTLATIAALLLTESCKKDALPTTAQGRVTTLGTETPLAGIAVTLIEDNYGGGVLGGNGGYNGPLKTVHTDQDGYYRIDHDCNPSTAYWVEFETAEGHFGPIQKQQVYPGQNNTINMKQIPFAWLKVRFKNVNPYNVYDYVGFDFVTPAVPSSGGFQGPGIDTELLIRVGGNMESIIQWSSKKNGVWNDNADTIYITMSDTINYEIFY